MNSIDRTNNLNFNATLNINGLKKDKARWNNIAKIFEEKTAKQYPEDTFYLESLGKGKGIRIDDQEVIDDRNGCVMNEKLYNRLMNLPDDKIAGKFKKLLVCLEWPLDSARKLAEKTSSLADESSVKKSFENLNNDGTFDDSHWDACTELFDIVYDAVRKTLRNKTNKTIANDSILKHLDMEIY